MECIAIRKGKGGKKKHREGKSKGKKQNKNNNNRKKAQKHDNSNQHAAESNTQAKGKKRKRGQGSSLTKLQEKFRQKLEGSQFRWLNEELYTKTSEEAYRMIQDNTALFNVYHNGFESQVSKWPENPVDTIIDFLRTLPSSRCIGDFGCGDARIARTLADHMNLIHSFDLAKANKHVTVCNIKHVPLKNETLDVAIFCLSLMGIDFADFIKEANRVLKVGGTLIIAEVKSRFTQQNIDGKVAKGDHDSMLNGIESFVQLLSELGFENVSTDIENQMFVLFHFEKRESFSKKKRKHKLLTTNFVFKSCKYKKR